jgi:hypothetical protein
MPVIASAPDLTLQLLKRAERLGDGQTLHAWHLVGQRHQPVLDVMEALLCGGFAVGSLIRNPLSRGVEDASLYGLTAKGKRLQEQLTQARGSDSGQML